MALMNPKADFSNFSKIFSGDGTDDFYKRVSYLPSHNLFASLTLTGEVLVFAGGHSYESGSLQSFKPIANIVPENDKPTCIYLMVVSSKRRVIGGNWCCVVVGTQSGSLLFYNKQGVLLLRQSLFSNAVTNICALFDTTLSGYIYASSGSSLNMVAYLELVAELENHSNIALLTPNKANVNAALNWKSLHLLQAKNTQQIALTGHATPESQFDQLERSTIERYSSRELSNAQNIQVSSIGADPFYQFTASREVVQTSALDLAVAVTSTLIRAISYNVPFLGSKNSAQEPELTPEITSMNVLTNHGIFDRDRLATHLCVSPSKRFIAVVDSLARVCVIDSKSGIPLYLIKGYRKAQLGWITSSSLDGSGRRLELLVIFSAKSMQIELWNSRKATRVSAFSAPEGQGTLLYDSGNVSGNDSDEQFPAIDRQAHFLTKSGILYDVTIPFSEALEFEDLAEMQGHLDDLAEVRSILLQYNGEKLERFEKLLKRFRRVSLIQQILKLVSECPNADESLVETTVNTFKGATLRGARKATQRLQASLSKIERLLTIYQHLKQTSCNTPKQFQQVPNCSDLDIVRRYQGVFAYDNIYDNCDFSLERMSLCEFLNSFSILSDDQEKEIFVDDEGELLVANTAHEGCSDEELFRLFNEHNVCMWSITKSLLRSFFKSSLKEDQLSSTYTALGKVIAELKANCEDIEPFLQKAYEEISSTENIPAAILASYMMRCLLGVPKQSLLEEVEEPLECRVFEGLFKQLQTIIPLAALLRCRINDDKLAKNDCPKIFPISLKSLRKSQGYVSDLISQWICEQRLSHSHLKKALSSVSSLANNMEDILDEPTISLDTALQLLCDVRVVFPVSLQLETLLANCCWSYICLWDNNYQDIEPLHWTLDYLVAIQAYKLKDGLCNMIWKTLLQSRVISIAKIMEQSKTLPDGQLERHVRVGKYVLLDFLNFCSSILDIIIECMLPSEDIEVLCPLLKEDVLSPGFSEGDPSLISMALSLPQALRETVHLHYSLVTILTNCVRFNLDDVQPLSLFDSAAQTALSEDLCKVYTRYNQSTSANAALSNLRLTFLRRSIEACVQLLPDTCKTEELLDCQATMSRLVDLAHSWDIDSDVLNKEYVLQLYSCGHDQLAQEIMPQISERRPLIESLMVIIGLRVRYLLGEIDNTTCEKLGSASTRLSRWLDGLPDRTLRFSNKSIDSTMVLVQNVLHLLRSGEYEEHLLNDVILLLTSLDSPSSN